MGVKDLWSVLSPVCEKKSLWELQDKVIAIDLSAWICDSQCLNKNPQYNMYLRNLFFRTSYLLLLGVKPIFVLDGKAPNLKVKTMQKRMNKNGIVDNENNINKVVNRPRLKGLQKQCIELLSSLGVSYVVAPGEAEAHCAHLNQQGLVDAIISQDSDTFLYGARIVLRNFQMAPYYTCDAYYMDKIEAKLGLSRTKLIGFSILTGSDYSSGVHNVGKEMALKFLASLPDDLIFQRFVRWKDSSNYISSIQQKPGDIDTMAIEIAVRDRAIQDENFPNLDVIEEFTYEPGALNLECNWQRPNLFKFMMLAHKKLMWEEEYSTLKMAPLIGRWHLENNGEDCGIKIVSINASHGKPSHYKVTWDLSDVTTTEKKELVQKVYPTLVANYEESKITKGKTKGKKNNKRKKVDDNIEDGPNEKVNTKTLLDDYESELPNNVLGKLLVTDESNYLNLSGIIQDIVTRPNSNPALDHLSNLI